MDSLRRLNDNTSGAQYAGVNSATTSTAFAVSKSSMSGIESSIRATIELSTTRYGGHVNARTFFDALDRYAMTSCGMALPSPSDFRGLVTFDKDIEGQLSPVLTENSAQHIRRLSRDILKSNADRRALLESLGFTSASPVALALFGDPSEYSQVVTLDFERRLVAHSASRSLGDIPTDIIPVSPSAVKYERRSLFSPGERDQIVADAADGRPSIILPMDGGKTGHDGDTSPSPSASAEDKQTNLPAESDDAREFIRIVFGRFEAAYGSPQVGLLVLRRLLGCLEVPADDDLLERIRDISHARIVADEFGIKAPPSSASSGQRKAFISELKSKFRIFLEALKMRGSPSPSPLQRARGGSPPDGLSELRPIIIPDDDALDNIPRRGRVDGEVKDITARLELERSIQARLTASQLRFQTTIAKIRALSRTPLASKFATTKGLPVAALLELDGAMHRQALLFGLAQKAMALSASTPGGLMARRAALVLNKPDAHFAKMVPSLLEPGGGLDKLSVLERTFGIFPTESWALAAALQEYSGTPNATAEELYHAAERSTWKDSAGQPSVSRDYLAIFELIARADGEEVDFNIERVFNAIMGGIERVGLGHVPEWNTLWRNILTKSLKWKAAGHIQRAALDDTVDLIGEYSLTEATAQQIRSVYASAGTLVAEVLLDDAPFGAAAPRHADVVCMDKPEFDAFDVLQLSAVGNPHSDRRACFKCSSPLMYGSDFCPSCPCFVPGTVFCSLCNAPTQESTARTGLCRGYAVNLCTPKAGQLRAFRSTPTPEDFQRAAMRHDRLLELRNLRAPAPVASLQTNPPSGGRGRGKGKGGNGRRNGGDARDTNVSLVQVSSTVTPQGVGEVLAVSQAGPDNAAVDGGTHSFSSFAVDIRLACLPRQVVPLLSVGDLDRALHCIGGSAEVLWGEQSRLSVYNGLYSIHVPLSRDGGYIEVRGETGVDRAFRVDPLGRESIIVDTGAAISCCGPDCPFLDKIETTPIGLSLVGANKSPWPVLKVGVFRLVFGDSSRGEFEASFVTVGHNRPASMSSYNLTRQFEVTTERVERKKNSAFLRE